MGLLTWFFDQVDDRPKTGWALMPDEGAATPDPAEPPAQSCQHDWEEASREGLGYDGGGYHDGLGQYWYLVTHRCRACGESKSEETT